MLGVFVGALLLVFDGGGCWVDAGGIADCVLAGRLFVVNVKCWRL